MVVMAKMQPTPIRETLLGRDTHNYTASSATIYKVQKADHIKYAHQCKQNKYEYIGEQISTLKKEKNLNAIWDEKSALNMTQNEY